MAVADCTLGLPRGTLKVVGTKARVGAEHSQVPKEKHAHHCARACMHTAIGSWRLCDVCQVSWRIRWCFLGTRHSCNWSPRSTQPARVVTVYEAALCFPWTFAQAYRNFRYISSIWLVCGTPTGAVDPFPAGIHGQASASLEIWASDGSSFDGPKGVYYGVEAPSLWMPLPA